MTEINRPAPGTLVEILDGSECHGERGTVYVAGTAFLIVELENGTLWPVRQHEFRKVDVLQSEETS